jgi:hypothetical protein
MFLKRFLRPKNGKNHVGYANCFWSVCSSRMWRMPKQRHHNARENITQSSLRAS